MQPIDPQIRYIKRDAIREGGIFSVVRLMVLVPFRFISQLEPLRIVYYIYR